MGKKKKKGRKASLWERLRSNPEAISSMLQGLGGVYAGVKGFHTDPKTGKYFKPELKEKPPGATR